MKKAAAALVFACTMLVMPFNGAATEMARQPADLPEPLNDITPQLYPSGAPEVLYKKATCYGQLVQWYLDLETKHPDYFKTFYANVVYATGKIPGQGSAACAPQPGPGYDTLYIRMTNEKTGIVNKPEVFFMGPLHGDEKTGANGNYWFADWAMRTALDPLYVDAFWTPYLNWMFDNREVYFEASHNPYGYDATVRGDVDGDDLNREGDMDCCGATNKGLWGAINGKTSREFVARHQIRAGTDWHGGAHALLTAWKSTHDSVSATSPISGSTQRWAAPDFFYFNVGMHRAAEIVGPYGGTMGASSIGPTPEVLGYESPGALSGWIYGADVTNNPVEAPYVKQGPYPGAGAYWPTFELSSVKNAAESEYGGDLTIKYGGQARRFMLFLTDLAQPHVGWDPTSVANNSQVAAGDPITFKWNVWGGLTADNTLMQYGTDPDPVKNPQQSTKENKQFDHKYQGGTVWDGSSDGKMTPHVWSETITLTTPGEYYFTAKSMVDQIYDTVAGEAEYGKNKTYLRMLKERLKPGWTETIQGEDGAETMTGRLWWYSPVVHITVGGDNTPPTVVLTSPADGAPAVPTNAQVVVTFSEAMDTASAEGAFSLNPAATGTFSWDAAKKVMTLDPAANLQPSTSYTGNVGTGAKDPSGNAMTSPKTWTFTTAATADIDPPRVISTDPMNGATGVSEKTKVKVTFNESMDKPTVEAGFSLAPAAAGTFAWPSADAVEFTPSADLRTQTAYTIKVAATASDPAGNKMVADYTGSFTTGGNVSDTTPPTVITTDPADGATQVPRDKPVTITFSEAMSRSFTENATGVDQQRNLVYSWSGEVMTFKPTVKWNPGCVLTVEVNTPARDLAGNQLVQRHTFSFTAEGDCVDKIPPEVYFTVPDNGAKDVPVTTDIKVGFSRDMNPQTLNTSFVVNPLLVFTVRATGYTATLEHVDDLKPNTKYTVTVSKEASSTEGLTLGAPHTFTFTTAGSGGPPPPPPNGTGGTGSSLFGGMLPILLVIIIMAVAVAAVAVLFAGKRKRERQMQQAYQQQQQQQQQMMWNQGGGGGGWQ